MQYSLVTQQQNVATEAIYSGRQPGTGKNSAAAQSKNLISAFCRKITPWALAGGTFLYNTTAAVATPVITKTITIATPTVYQFNQTAASVEDLLSKRGGLTGLIITLSAGSIFAALGLYQCVKICSRNTLEGLLNCQYDPTLTPKTTRQGVSLESDSFESGSFESDSFESDSLGSVRSSTALTAPFGAVRYHAATDHVEIVRAEPTLWTQQESPERDDAIHRTRPHSEASGSQHVVQFLPSLPASSGTEFEQYNQTLKDDQLFSEISLKTKPLSGSTGSSQTTIKPENEKAAHKEDNSIINTPSLKSVTDQIGSFEPESPFVINAAEIKGDTPVQTKAVGQPRLPHIHWLAGESNPVVSSMQTSLEHVSEIPVSEGSDFAITSGAV